MQDNQNRQHEHRNSAANALGTLTTAAPMELCCLKERPEPGFICHQKQIEKKCFLSSSHLPVSHDFLLLVDLHQKLSWQAWELWCWEL